jgi:hypothetical protein
LKGRQVPGSPSGGQPERSEDAGPAGGITEPVDAATQVITKAGRRRPCPNCGSRSVAAIHYGMPVGGPQETPGFEVEFVLGGCCVWPEMPDLHCNTCGYDWATPESLQAEATRELGNPLSRPLFEPIERRTYLAADLMRRHPPAVHDPQKAVILSIAAPADAVHSGSIEYTRWPAMFLPGQIAPGAAARLIEVRDGWFEYPAAEGQEAACQRVAWHVNFADAHLFGFYGGRFFAQDEVQVAEHPALGALREALLAEGLPALTIQDREPTPVLVAGVECRVAIDTAPNPAEGRRRGIYGGRNLAVVTEQALRLAIHPLDPPTITNVIAIAALANGRGRYTREEIEFTLRTAYTGFRAAVLESRRIALAGFDPWAAGTAPPGRDRLPSPQLPEVTIHTGFWGCGAFGGNRVLMTLLQLLAAQLAGVDRLIYYVGDPSGRAPVDRALALARDLLMVTDTDTLVGRIVALELEWGNSDGN